MMNVKVWIVAVVVSSTMLCAARADEKVDAAIKEVLSAASKIDSMKADVQAITESGKKDEKSSYHRSEAIASIEHVRKNDHILTRYDGTSSGENRKAGQHSVQIDNKMLMIVDEEYTYWFRESKEGKVAMKTEPSNAGGHLPDEGYFKAIRKAHDLKLMPEEEEAGKRFTVFAGEPVKGSPSNAGSIGLYFDKETGLLLKKTLTRSDGKPFRTTKLKNVRTNGNIDSERFVFKAPEGVRVQDLTRQSPPPQRKAVLRKVDPKKLSDKKSESQKENKKKSD